MSPAPACCMCSSRSTLGFQMERKQGEVDHLERPSPLTDKERVMIQDSWGKVYQNCDDAGVAILVRYSVTLFFASQLKSFMNSLHPIMDAPAACVSY